ncbi:hypothetical protein ACVBKF_00255 [Shewanella sp. 0m-11]
MNITTKVLTTVIIAFFVAVLLPYLITFNGGLSKTPENWAHFGTYIGGTLGPIGAFLAFWGLMQQNRMYKDSAAIERVTSKLNLLDSEISILATHCTGTTFSGPAKQQVTYDLSPLLLRNDPLSARLIENKPETNLANNVGLHKPCPNYRVVLSIVSKIKLMQQYLHTMKHLDDGIDMARCNDTYCHLLKALKSKGWIDFEKFSH